MNEDTAKRRKSLVWSRAERSLLVLTFLCTLIATVYSVRTARRALKQSEYALRPWISIPSVQTYFESDIMDTKFEIVNVGQLPAYVKTCVYGSLNGEKSNPDLSSNPDTVYILLPGQRIWRAGLSVRGKTYERIKQGDTSLNVTQNIHVDYGTSRNSLDHFTRHTIRLDIDDLPEIAANTNRPGLWDIEDGDFE